MQPVAEKPAATPKADKPAGDGFPKNPYDRAGWEEIIKGGTLDQMAARVAARFKDDPKKHRADPKNFLRWHPEYVADMKAAGKLPK
mgnify:CR=1 FL=1